MKLSFELVTAAGMQALAVDIHTFIVAGWAGRDMAAIEHHIEELAELGVPMDRLALTFVAPALLVAAPLLLVCAGLLAALSPQFASAQQIAPDDARLLAVKRFERTFGKFEGFRRSGAKGVCAVGSFVGSAEGRALSVSSAFSGQPVPVVVRFSVGGANPKAPDNTRGQRNLALQFNLPGGETWQMGNISAPVFGAATPEQFLGRLESLTPDPETKRPNPDRVKAFADANPDVLLQGKYFASQPVPASFGKVNYWGVHAFGFVNASGSKQFGKWIFEPVGGVQGLAEVVPRGPARLGLVVQHHEHIGDGFRHRRELPRRLLVDPVQGRELRGRMMDCLSCDCIGRIQSCHDSPLW